MITKRTIQTLLHFTSLVTAYTSFAREYNYLRILDISVENPDTHNQDTRITLRFPYTITLKPVKK